MISDVLGVRILWFKVFRVLGFAGLKFEGLRVYCLNPPRKIHKS